MALHSGRCLWRHGRAGRDAAGGEGGGGERWWRGRRGAPRCMHVHVHVHVHVHTRSALGIAHCTLHTRNAHAHAYDRCSSTARCSTTSATRCRKVVAVGIASSSIALARRLAAGRLPAALILTLATDPDPSLDQATRCPITSRRRWRRTQSAGSTTSSSSTRWQPCP